MRSPFLMVILVTAASPLVGQGPPPDNPGRLLTAYLYQRQVITHERPVVLMCGSEANAAITPEVRADVITRQRLADSIVIAPVCPATPLSVPAHTYPVVRIGSIVIRADTSRIEALASAVSTGQPPYSHGRRERFLMVEGRREGSGSYTPPHPSLLFYEFAPPNY